METARGLTAEAVDALALNMPWMTWNLTLAFVPLALAAVLFTARPRRSVLWWTGVIAFVAFLPNAAYVLTDVIHLVRDVRTIPSVAVVSFAVLPQYALFFVLGFGAYVLSILAVGRYAARSGRASWVVPIELGLHGLSAIGIYFGRFLRLNSWDLVARPESVADGWYALAGVRAAAAVAFTFVVVSALYGVLKPVTIALLRTRPADPLYGG